MFREPKTPNRFADAPRDKPQVEPIEHANLVRPGAKTHPRAAGWNQTNNKFSAWRQR